MRPPEHAAEQSKAEVGRSNASRTSSPSIVRSLGMLVDGGVKFSIVYADPPWPYLELYGHEEHPNSGWTVYGNQVERRLF